MPLNNSAGAAVTAHDGNGAAGTAPNAAGDIATPFPLEPADEILIGDNDAAPEDEGSQPSATNDASSESEADASTPDGEDAPAEDGEQEAKQRNKVPAKERIKQLSDTAKAAVRRAEQAEQRERNLTQQLAKLEGRERPGEAADYDTDAAYAQALVTEAVNAAKAEALKDARADAAQERNEARRDEWIEKSAPMRSRVADFDAVVANPQAPISEFMKDAIVADPAGPEIAYFLGKNPEEARRIARLAPLQQATEIGRLASRFETAPVAKKITKAPPVRQTLEGHGSPPPKDPAKMTTEQYRAWRSEVSANKAKAGVRR